jgi:hypothetical protein
MGTAEVTQANGVQFSARPGIVRVSAVGLDGAETANVDEYIGGGEWVPAFDVMQGDAAPQMDATTPYHYFAGGGRYRVYKSATTAPINIKIQHVSAFVLGTA